MAKRKKTRVRESDRRVAFTVRLPAWLLSEFRTICERKEPGEQTRVIEEAVERYVKRERRKR